MRSRLSFIICLLLNLNVQFAHASTIVLTQEDDIATSISYGKYGDVFMLTCGEYNLSTSILVPNGVTIQGSKDCTIIKQNSTTFPFTFFNLKNAEDITFDSFSIMLGPQGIGFATTSDNVISTNIKIRNILIRGNLEEATTAENQSSAGIYLTNIKNSEISNSRIFRTRGGIYVTGNNITITANFLKQVNLGSIAVDGNYFLISNNIINESGKATPISPAGGDAITIGEYSYDIQIIDNIIETGYCYLIWAHHFVNKLKIIGNIIKDGITSGVYIQNSSNVQIQNNTFISNQGYGLALEHGATNVTIRENQFYSNAIWCLEGSNVTILDNTFDKIAYEQNPIVVNNDIKTLNNTINYLDLNTVPLLTLVTIQNGGQQAITSGGTIHISPTNTDKINLFLRNQGNQLVKFTGRPAVFLSTTVNQLTDISQYNISIKNYDQITKLSLEPDDIASFIITIKQRGLGEFFIIVPTDLDTNNPMWFKIVID